MADETLREMTDTGTQVLATMVETKTTGGFTNWLSSNGTSWGESGPASGPSLQLEDTGLGVVSFGASPAQVESALGPLLGLWTASPESGCDPHQFSEIEWDDLVVEFNQGFFTGYRDILGGWTSIGSPRTPSGPPNPKITTAAGIGVADSLSQLESAYPGLKQSGSFTFTSADRIHFVVESNAYPPAADSPIDEIKIGTCGDF